MRSARQLVMEKWQRPWRRRTEPAKIKPLRAAPAAQFFSLMADVLAVGFSLREGLNFARIMLPRQRVTITAIQASLSTGMTFSNAVQPFVDVDCYYQLKIAEENGALGLVLTNLGNFLALKHRQQQKVRAVLRYPLAILGLLLLLMLAVKQVLAPELRELVPHRPSLTGPWSLVWVGGGCLMMTIILIGIWRLWRHPRLERVVVGCHCPILGGLLRLYWHYYLALNLGLLLASGLQSHDVLRLLKTYQPRSVLRQLADELDVHLKKGATIAQFVDRYAFLPTTFTMFFSKGLTTQQLAKDLRADAQLTYQRLFTRIESLIGLVQPLLFGVIGAGIIGLYLSLLLPMYQAIGGLS
ncbi:type II secretion system F family protein [Furfurilactobacillus sp. WILCCON 0119]